MRMDPIAPEDLTDEQRVLDRHVRQMTDGLHMPFVWKDERGALIGPFPALLRFPELARPLLEWFTSVTSGAELPPRVREAAILATGSRYGAAYELYSHSTVALAVGLSPGAVAELVAGRRPDDLTPEESGAYDLAAQLCTTGPVPEALYEATVGVLGEAGTAALVFLIAQYAGISMVLNTYDVPLPARGAGHGT